MKRRARTFKVVPGPAGKPSAVVARALEPGPGDQT